MVINEESN
ncbi:hypothetical protein VCR5J5_1370188 [Vibrio crassostreae]|uniref:Uncharacterized protein n=1 Tax=Vibrio crassostreae TaxID=246167 RepID=A0A822MTM5_9VIBR|nr:hypothetical protein VCR5J5_1370188 [Vibrio crassostreae]